MIQGSKGKSTCICFSQCWNWSWYADLNAILYVTETNTLLTVSDGKKNVAMISPERMMSDIPYTASTHCRMMLRSGLA